MFSKRPKPKAPASSSAAAPRKDLRQVLEDAVARNTSVGLVRLGRSGQDPLAQGRLLSWNDGTLVVEQLQIIGRTLDFHTGTRVEGYVNAGGTMLAFESEIKHIDTPTKLNDQKVVRSVKLADPVQLREGDRRSAYRVSLPASMGEIPIRIWFLDRVRDPAKVSQADRDPPTNKYYTDLLAAVRAESLFPEPDDDGNPVEFDWTDLINGVMERETPHAVGRLLDITPNGIGVLMYGVSKMQLDRFERIAMDFELDGETMHIATEMRHAVDLRGGTCRVGYLLVHPSPRDVHAPARKALERIAMQIQRDQLKSRSAA